MFCVFERHNLQKRNKWNTTLFATLRSELRERRGIRVDYSQKKSCRSLLIVSSSPCQSPATYLPNTHRVHRRPSTQTLAFWHDALTMDGVVDGRRRALLCSHGDASDGVGPSAWRVGQSRRGCSAASGHRRNAVAISTDGCRSSGTGKASQTVCALLLLSSHCLLNPTRAPGRGSRGPTTRWSRRTAVVATTFTFRRESLIGRFPRRSPTSWL